MAVARRDSDEFYVLNLCDEILDEIGSRQHTFQWLLGDSSPRHGRRRRLQVDSFWPAHNLVVEYREIQHDRPVPHFDKPERITVSGVHRGLQRRIYDERRDTLIPLHGIRLVEIRPRDLASKSTGKLRRDRPHDVAALGVLLSHQT